MRYGRGEYLALDSKILALVVCGLMLAGVVGVTLNIMRQSESAVAARVRTALAGRLTGLRLGRMLARRGIAASTYLDSVTTDVARHQMSACENCAAVARCEAALEIPAAGADFSFCPNDETIGALVPGAADDHEASGAAGCARA